MAKKVDIGRSDEFDALKDIQGVDSAKLLQDAGETPAEILNPGDPGYVDHGASGGPKPGDPGYVAPAIKPGDPGYVAPILGGSDTDQQRGALLKEIFGERFKTVDEVKQANINGQLEELEGLRRTKTELETKLASKPKHNFANDEVALYNEFVKETGIKDYGVFSRINVSDIANMDPMDALVTKHILENPQLIGKEERVRKFFQDKYNVTPIQDPTEEEIETLERNQIGVDTDGSKAKEALQVIKGKLKLPEPVSSTEAPKELTPEEKTALQTGWNNVGAKVVENLAKLNVPIKGAKTPILSYELSEDDIKETKRFITDYATENRLELNKDNVSSLASIVYNQLMLNHLPEIVHSVFEKARKMTEKEVIAIYTNPSGERNKDQPPSGTSPVLTDAEKLEQELFDAEMKMYEG